ncbi:hypothetical protein ACP275_11G094700 [Erythranthe tilingii]
MRKFKILKVLLHLPVKDHQPLLHQHLFKQTLLHQGQMFTALLHHLLLNQVLPFKINLALLHLLLHQEGYMWEEEMRVYEEEVRNSKNRGQQIKHKECLLLYQRFLQLHKQLFLQWQQLMFLQMFQIPATLLCAKGSLKYLKSFIILGRLPRRSAFGKFDLHVLKVEHVF